MITPSSRAGIINSLRNYTTAGLIANVDLNNNYGFSGNTAHDLQKPAIKYNTPGGFVSVISGSTGRPSYIEFDGVTDYLIATQGATGAATEFGGLTCGTVDVWVYIAQTTASPPTLVSNNSLNTGATARGFSLITTQSPPIARFAFNNGTSTLGVSIPGLTGATGEWNNYFGRFEADGNNAKVTGIVFRPSGLSAYNLITGATAANLANGMTSNNLLAIGRRSAQATQYLNGRIGSVRIYNRLLSQSEMEFNYNRSKTRYGHT